MFSALSRGVMEFLVAQQGNLVQEVVVVASEYGHRWQSADQFVIDASFPEIMCVGPASRPPAPVVARIGADVRTPYTRDIVTG